MLPRKKRFIIARKSRSAPVVLLRIRPSPAQLLILEKKVLERAKEYNEKLRIASSSVGITEDELASLAKEARKLRRDVDAVLGKTTRFPYVRYRKNQLRVFPKDDRKELKPGHRLKAQTYAIQLNIEFISTKFKSRRILREFEK